MVVKKLNDFSSFDDLNHKFVDAMDDLNFNIEFTKCSICNFRVWVGEKEFWYMKNHSWNILDITCEEMQIKRLLE